MGPSRREILSAGATVSALGLAGCLGSVREQSPLVGRHSGSEIEFAAEYTFGHRRYDTRASGYVSGDPGPKSGAETAWTYQLDAESYPLIHDGLVFIGSDNGLYALDGRTSAKQWRYPSEERS